MTISWIFSNNFFFINCPCIQVLSVLNTETSHKLFLSNCVPVNICRRKYKSTFPILKVCD